MGVDSVANGDAIIQREFFMVILEIYVISEKNINFTTIKFSITYTNLLI